MKVRKYAKKINLMISARESDEKLPLKDVCIVAELNPTKQSLQYEKLVGRHSLLNNKPAVSYGIKESTIIL